MGKRPEGHKILRKKRFGGETTWNLPKLKPVKTVFPKKNVGKSRNWCKVYA